jgi:two-component system cell cycle sensor histidine kinase/response regulator CckA
MARIFAYLYGAGGTLVLVTIPLLGSGERFLPGLVGVPVVAYGVVGLMLFGFDRLPVVLFRALPGFGALLVSIVAASGGADAADAYALLYFWVVLSAFYFFPPRQALPNLAVVAIAYAAVLVIAGPVEDPALRWLMLLGTLTVASLVLSLLRARIRQVIDTMFDDIARRKRAEARLRKSEAQLAEAQRIARLGSWEWDIQTDEITWSDELYRIYGLDPGSSTATYDGYLRRLHPDDGARVDATVRQALEDRAPFELEHRIVAEDGEIRTLLARGRVITDDAGASIRMVGTAQDISEQKRLEDIITRFWTLSLDPLAIVDFDGNVRRVSPAGERVLGWSTDELSTTQIELIHPEDRERILRDTTLLRDAERQTTDLEARVACGDGSYRRLLCSARSSPDEGLIYIVAKDITERERAEQAKRLAAIVESSEDGIVSIGTDLTINSWNHGAERIFGHVAIEAVGRPLAMLLPADRSHELADTVEVIELGTTSIQHDTVRLGKDGRPVDVSLSLSPIRDDSGTITGASAIYRDITERVRAQRENDLLQAELQEARRLESVGQLAGGIAHDFNNILAVVANYARFVAQELPPSSQALKDVQEIQNAADRAAALTSQLLIFSRRDVVVPRVLSINAVVSELDGLLRSALGERVELEHALSPDTAPVRAGSGQLEQVLINLAVNGRDAMPDGGTLTIETENLEPDDGFLRFHPDATNDKYVCLRVRDTGTGMEPEVVARAFEPFFTTKPKGQGTGLGLATVYGVVKHAGGIIDVRSEPGRGTVFEIYLPAANEEFARREPRPRRSAPIADGETVLVVEDQAPVRRMVQRVLTGAGYRVLSANGGKEALELCARGGRRIDLVLTDVVMPEMLGPELVKRMSGRCKGLSVVYMSGYGHDSLDGDSLSEPDGAGFLEKPFTAEELLDEVHRALSGNRVDALLREPG